MQAKAGVGGEIVEVEFERAGETELVERGRAQSLDEVAQAGDDLR